MTETEGESGTKGSGGKDKDYFMKCTQDVCIIEYKGEIRYLRHFKWIPLVNTYGETAVQLFGVLKVILGIISILIAFILLGKVPGYWEGLARYLVGTCVVVIFYVSATFILQGISSQFNAKFLKFLKCKRCGRSKAYEEKEKPDIREYSTEKSYTVTIIRYWK